LNHAGLSVAVIGSGRSTTEELYLLRRIATEGLHADFTDIVPRSGKADGFLVSADRNPNTLGAYLTEVSTAPGAALPDIAKAIAAGKIHGLLVLNENITKYGISPELLARLQFLVVIDSLPNAVTELAHIVIPGMTFAEKQGTFINAKGRIQRLNVAVRLEGDVRPEWQTLASLLTALGGASHASFDDVFSEMCRRIPVLHGLTYAGIGDLGTDLKLAEKPGEEGVAWTVP
jgi:NADH-quinone oxidoreductase subunit G